MHKHKRPFMQSKLIPEPDKSHKVQFFFIEGCPFCSLVKTTLEELHIEYDAHQVSTNRDDETRLMLKEKSKVNTVPVIQIGTLFIGDSGKIISYLKRHYKSSRHD